MSLTQQQQLEAKNKIERWFKQVHNGGEQIFTLAGYAGTGKTFLINYLIQNVFNLDENEIATVTPTGKAASVLIQKGTSACTIHRLIYTCEDSDRLDKNGKPIPIFIKKRQIPNYKLIILDEVSMIGKRIMQDLISFGIPILAVGDPGQLPPVLAERHDLLVKPNHILTEIVRQSADDPIIQVATMARNGEVIPYGRYGESVVVIPRKSISDKTFNNLLLKADQVICGKNATRNELNNYIRELLGFTSKYPQQNDKIICTQNNYELSVDDNELYPLVNGNIGYVESFNRVNESENISLLQFKADFLEKDYNLDKIAIDDSIFDSGIFKYDRHQRVYFLDNGEVHVQHKLRDRTGLSDSEYRKKVSQELYNRNHSDYDIQLAQFEYGYAISCHKSQGSEFDKVVVFDESKAFPGESKRWLYTAITRAKQKLVIIR